MISILRTDSVEFKEVRRCAVSIHADEPGNPTRRVVMVRVSIDKPAHEPAFNCVTVEAALTEDEQQQLRRWAEARLKGPVKMVMSV